MDESTDDDDDDIVPENVRQLNATEQCLEDGEADHLSSVVDIATIRTAKDFDEFSRSEKSKTQLRNEAIAGKRAEKITQISKVRNQEESREKMEEMKVMVMASCLKILSQDEKMTMKRVLSNVSLR